MDYTRHLSVFSPVSFGDTRVDVIGAGATGSKVVLELAKLGVQELHVWDFDKVEEHNVANQAFGVGDIGRPKVTALAAMVDFFTDLKINPHSEKVTKSTELGDVVFLLTDTMSSRKDIYDGIKKRGKTRWLIETRMGVDSMRIYGFDPRIAACQKAWEAAWYPDEKAEASACGARVTVGPTATMLSGVAVWSMLQWNLREQGKTEDIVNETILGIRPPAVFTNKWV